MTSQKSAGELIAKLIDLLSGIDEESRHRALSAVQTYFSIPTAPPTARATIAAHPKNQDDSDSAAFPEKARLWLRQSNLALDELERVFHVGASGCELIAPGIPGRSKKDQTFNVYMLVGVSKLLENGNPNFEDKEARAACITHGCYDPANHAANFKDRGNEFAGSKDGGWTLTAPGLRAAGALVKELAQQI